MAKQTKLDQILGEYAEPCLDEILQRSDPAHDSDGLTELLRKSVIRKYLDKAHPSLPIIADFIQENGKDNRMVHWFYEQVIDMLYDDLTPSKTDNETNKGSTSTEETRE